MTKRKCDGRRRRRLCGVPDSNSRIPKDAHEAAASFTLKVITNRARRELSTRSRVSSLFTHLLLGNKADTLNLVFDGYALAVVRISVWTGMVMFLPWQERKLT